ncbi:uncharacterized protein LOC123643781 [Lemur catta]|uniref:uncharacterized protein LOC123643781 n=1 Tax=Lemur catta TaxID=9447 RepID=UPI001E26667A|nr:uncharacterized protein LOC123643781 [Lemur catta]
MCVEAFRGAGQLPNYVGPWPALASPAAEPRPSDPALRLAVPIGRQQVSLRLGPLCPPGQGLDQVAAVCPQSGELSCLGRFRSRGVLSGATGLEPESETAATACVPCASRPGDQLPNFSGQRLRSRPGPRQTTFHPSRFQNIGQGVEGHLAPTASCAEQHPVPREVVTETSLWEEGPSSPPCSPQDLLRLQRGGGPAPTPGEETRENYRLDSGCVSPLVSPSAAHSRPAPPRILCSDKPELAPGRCPINLCEMSKSVQCGLTENSLFRENFKIFPSALLHTCSREQVSTTEATGSELSERAGAEPEVLQKLFWCQHFGLCQGRNTNEPGPLHKD